MACDRIHLDRTTSALVHWYTKAVRTVLDEEEKARRQKKKLDRIQQKAEAAQRFAKGGHWK